MSKLVWALALLIGAFVSTHARGVVTDIEEYPSLTQVEVKVGQVWVQQCAGTIITNRHIVTAASCFSGPLYIREDRQIRAGSSQRNYGGALYAVETEIIHSDYGLLGDDADIAIVRLNSYLTLGNNVQQAVILGQGIEMPGGLIVYLAGWGSTVKGDENDNDQLYSVDLTVNNNEVCLEKYLSADTSAVITENMVCVGLTYTTGRDFDLHDVGAPLFFSNTLVGIMSFGRIADDELPAVATAVGSFTEWITSNAV